MFKKTDIKKIFPEFIETRQTPRNKDCHLILNPCNNDEIFMIPKHTTLKNDKIYVYNVNKLQIDILKRTDGNVSLCKDVLQKSYLANKHNIKLHMRNQQHQSRPTEKRKQRRRKLQQQQKYQSSNWIIRSFLIHTIETQNNIVLMANLLNVRDTITYIKEFNIWIIFDVQQKQFKVIKPDDSNHSEKILSEQFSCIPTAIVKLNSHLLNNDWLFIMVGKLADYCKMYVFRLNRNNNYYPIYLKTLSIPQDYEHVNQAFVIKNIKNTVANVQHLEFVLFGGATDTGYFVRYTEIVEFTMTLPNIDMRNISKYKIPCFCLPV